MNGAMRERGEAHEHPRGIEVEQADERVAGERGGVDDHDRARRVGEAREQQREEVDRA